MELIIQILVLFIVINCILKLSFWKPWQAAIFGVACAVFIIGTYQYAIQQSKMQINDYLQNTKALQDAAVLVTIESAICFAALRELFGKTKKRWVRPLYWYPSLLIFPVLFYLLTQTIFGMSGADFATIAYVLAAVILIGFPLSSFAIRYFVSEKELRLEVHFLVSLFVCILGLLTTVNANVTYAAAEEPINYIALFWSIGLFVLTFVLGFFWNKIKWIIKQKKGKK